MFRIEFHLDIWVFHAELTDSVAVRSAKDIQLATDIRKLLHTKRTLDGHIIFGFVTGEFPGMTVFRATASSIVTTRLTWMGENRVRYEDS